jgi:hypothetical protein
VVLEGRLRRAQHAGVKAGPNPSIGAEATRKALGASQEQAANQRDVRDEQAVLNAADLQELEHAEYYPDEPAAPAERSFLDRLLGRPGH